MRGHSLERERVILKQIDRLPGVSLRQIQRLTDIPLSTVQRLLNDLEAAGKIHSERGASNVNYRRFYPIGKGLHKRERILLGFLNKPRPRTILQAIRDQPGIQHWELADRVGIPAPTATYYMKRIVQEDLVVVRKNGIKRHYRIKNPTMLDNALRRTRGGYVAELA